MMKPELLSPAGTLKNMRYAFAYGADAVYAGQPRYSLRVRNNEFTHENLALGISEAHALGKKFYVVVNIAPHNAKLKTFIRDLAPVVAMQPDALIMSDPGLIMLVRDAFPTMPVHLSVQANAVNWATVKFWQQMGLSRVILSRELSLEEIAEIRQQVPEMELEVFVHGALCMAYSGRCLLSGYMNKRDPNQGTCTNACRWEYKVAEGQQDEVGNIVDIHQPVAVQDVTPTLGVGQPTDKVFLLEEKMKPGEVMSAFEDEHGTYIMNSRDLRAVAHVERLSEMGVHSLKIEGRTKSYYYCARTAQVYRRAIDDAAAGKPFDPSLLLTLEGLAHRGYTEGFLRRHTHDSYQNYQQGFSVSDRQQFVGEFTGERRGEWAEVAVKNKFMLHDSVEIMTPQGNLNCQLDALQNARGEPTEVAPGDGHRVWLRVPEEVDLRFALLLRNFDHGEDTRDPHNRLPTETF
ncbi:prephenate-dependent tRNA uridine(34) hydroxylase TrhP [[Curtobacterium] plantarum]|uniref:prephenate-dependent tRNA uridine(34) hydroxylase TrhP n=1 Tax=[Curtobacterium] plantarum TaxID=221276 RepID=UPI0021D79FCB|nr:tRNA 5-hydroxyuridine modification protein YegQ [[Curtobacterium] plantarum]